MNHIYLGQWLGFSIQHFATFIHFIPLFPTFLIELGRKLVPSPLDLRLVLKQSAIARKSAQRTRRVRI
ncbi:MAG: hypothetical protein CL675_06495 [Bdellovibrionaceae bacterium]|nr:hypothetical protein [Pseudobdellovibrionaceae bacterium]